LIAVLVSNHAGSVPPAVAPGMRGSSTTAWSAAGSTAADVSLRRLLRGAAPR